MASSASQNIDPAKIDVLIEYLAYLTEDQHQTLLHPTEGIMSLHKFLPEKADIRAFLDERKAKAEQFKPAHTHYSRLEPDDPSAPWNSPRETDAERKRRVVREKLGYNPGEVPPKSELTMPTAEDLNNLEGMLKLKKPTVSDATPSLVKAIREQDELNEELGRSFGPLR